MSFIEDITATIESSQANSFIEQMKINNKLLLIMIKHLEIITDETMTEEDLI